MSTASAPTSSSMTCVLPCAAACGRGGSQVSAVPGPLALRHGGPKFRILTTVKRLKSRISWRWSRSMTSTSPGSVRSTVRSAASSGPPGGGGSTVWRGEDGPAAPEVAPACILLPAVRVEVAAEKGVRPIRCRGVSSRLLRVSSIHATSQGDWELEKDPPNWELLRIVGQWDRHVSARAAPVLHPLEPVALPGARPSALDSTPAHTATMETTPAPPSSAAAGGIGGGGTSAQQGQLQQVAANAEAMQEASAARLVHIAVQCWAVCGWATVTQLPPSCVPRPWGSRHPGDRLS